MNTSSVVIESKDIPEHAHARKQRVIVPAKVHTRDKKFEAIRMRMYRHFIETVTSSVVVFICLGLYKIAGVHAWWIQFVHKLIFIP